MRNADFQMDVRREELGDFLRNRRAQLTPKEVALPQTGRRRTPGLRREEVAELAGISAALYAWLEQGRDVPVSRRTIDAIAGALHLSFDDRAHLHYLTAGEEAEPRERLSPALRRMVDSMHAQPLFVLDHVWDIVLHNSAAEAVFGGPLCGTTNILESIFLDRGIQSLFLQWQKSARALLEMFRLDFARYTSDARVLALVERLRAQSPEFAQLWELHRVRTHLAGLTELEHPLAGRLTLEPTTYTVAEAPALRLLVFTPYDGETVQRLAAMIERPELLVPARA